MDLVIGRARGDRHRGVHKSLAHSTWTPVAPPHSPLIRHTAHSGHGIVSRANRDRRRSLDPGQPGWRGRRSGRGRGTRDPAGGGGQSWTRTGQMWSLVRRERNKKTPTVKERCCRFVVIRIVNLDPARAWGNVRGAAAWKRAGCRSPVGGFESSSLFLGRLGCGLEHSSSSAGPREAALVSPFESFSAQALSSADANRSLGLRSDSESCRSVSIQST